MIRNPVKARYPLREARVDVYDIPGKPGSYRSAVYICPHLQNGRINSIDSFGYNFTSPSWLIRFELFQSTL